MNHSSDFNETIRQTQHGDEVAIRSLIRSFGHLIRTECFDFRIDNLADVSIADLVQESWLKIWIRINEFRGHSDPRISSQMFAAWIRKTARNVIINYLRSRQARTRKPKGRFIPIYGDGQTFDLKDSMLTASAKLICSEQFDRLKNALEEIEDSHSRELLEQVFLEEKTLKESAAQLKISYDQARQRLAKGLAELRRLVD